MLLYARLIGSRTIDELPDWARALLDAERVARLAFVDDHDHPRVLPVTFAVADGAVWSAIDDKPKRRPEPARLRYLRRRPEAALCIDRYDDNWDRLAWVQLLGTITIVDIETAPTALAALSARYAPYRDRRPPGPLLRLEPTRALCWRA